MGSRAQCTAGKALAPAALRHQSTSREHLSAGPPGCGSDVPDGLTSGLDVPSLERYSRHGPGSVVLNATPMSSWRLRSLCDSVRLHVNAQQRAQPSSKMAFSVHHTHAGHGVDKQETEVQFAA